MSYCLYIILGGLSPLHQALRQSIEFNLSIDDPSLPLLRLMKILYSLNSHWTDLYQVNLCSSSGHVCCV